MTEKITLDEFDSQLTDLKLKDLQNKMDIVHNVIKQCEKRAGKGYKPSELSGTLEICSELTGVPLSTLSEAKALEQKTKKFNFWLLEQQQLLHRYDHEYSSTRKHLINSYTKELKIPTILGGNIGFEGFKNNFTFMQLPGTKSSIIVEKPEIVQERRKFLYTKMEYRKARKNIVYIGKINILQGKKITYKEDEIEEKNRFIIAVSPIFGHLGYIYCCGHNRTYINNWIQEKIMPELPTESVVIFQENVVLNDTSETIDSLSTKEHMLNWLRSNNVYHDPKMHRADLYKLIHTFKKGCEQLSPAEQTLKAHGHIVMRKKKCNLIVNYFDPFWDFFVQELNAAMRPTSKDVIYVSNSSSIATKINEILEKVTLKYWKNLEYVLLQNEQLIYKEDLEMEDTIDKLVTLVKSEGLPKDVELDKYCELMDQPPMYLHVSVRNTYMQHLPKKYIGLNIIS